MKALALSPAAEADLDHSWEHSATNWGLDQADRYTDEIRDACLDLAAGVRHGRPVDVRSGYLKYNTGAHMIYFRDQGDRLDIVRILHQRQDVILNLPK
ncbi:type II toxin-antitoxin system RelE/ParE family toxin [uncultured Agrobacterium sp.]|uniref:type II toxin-antitoxin system RelE/ParE family toxin n=1 Tax=uncultured Agrobacterium sp. TaxID=157277 RepID=UPI002587141B|nr:type II toxin-antitoxin system RelE/ParE family toxin [uncultured Agrobacterium sp.]